jgi:uncharacterized protein (DUF4213/DUF364 family)
MGRIDDLKGGNSVEDMGIAFPGTDGFEGPWALYNRMIEGIPEGVLVRDYCLGTHWSYLEAESGMGIAWTAGGGKKRAFKGDLRGRELREVAQLSKSWCFEEATLGIAALNAWYSQRDKLDPLGARYDEPVDLPDGTRRKLDAFELNAEYMDGKNVVMVGHFPHPERLVEHGASLTILERNVRDELDTPDPACEYVIPQADLVFYTGVTLINKTAPRLLQLAQNARVVMVGPSVVMSQSLFDYGVDMLAGSVVADPEKTRFAVQNGAGQFFGEALSMLYLEK